MPDQRHYLSAAILLFPLVDKEHCLHLLYFATVVTCSVIFHYTTGGSKQEFLKDVCMFSASFFPHDKVIDVIGLNQNIFACCSIDS